MNNLNLSRDTGYEVIKVLRTLSVIVKNLFLTITLLIMMMALVRFWFLRSASSKQTSSCARIEFFETASASRCKDFTEIKNVKNGLASSVPSSVAQAVVVSARELYYNHKLIFHNILNKYNIQVNETTIYFKGIDLKLNIVKFEKQLIDFGGLDGNS